MLEVLLSQEIPSEEVRKMGPTPGPIPARTKSLFPLVTPLRLRPAVEEELVHEIPLSDEVRMVSSVPTATKIPFP